MVLAPRNQEHDAALFVEPGNRFVALLNAGENQMRPTHAAQRRARRPGSGGIDDFSRAQWKRAARQRVARLNVSVLPTRLHIVRDTSAVGLGVENVFEYQSRRVDRRVEKQQPGAQSVASQIGFEAGGRRAAERAMPPDRPLARERMVKRQPRFAIKPIPVEDAIAGDPGTPSGCTSPAAIFSSVARSVSASRTRPKSKYFR